MLGLCNLCRFPVVRLNKTTLGTRCVRCRSSQVHRAMGLALAHLELPRSPRVYELSSRGAFFRFLSRRYSQFYFSEYYDDVPPGEKKGRVICQDVQKLLLEDGSFDLVTSTEVFEHVPDDRRGFREVHRVLAPGGHFVFTVPLADGPATVERCQLLPDGTLVHFHPPEYHGDRIRGRNAVLAFRNYGMDLIDRLEEAGFQAKVECLNSIWHSVRQQKVITARKE
jgi:SAM-dependent methyltransferase